LVESQSQADPKFQSAFAYMRMTAAGSRRRAGFTAGGMVRLMAARRAVRCQILSRISDVPSHQSYTDELIK